MMHLHFCMRRCTWSSSLLLLTGALLSSWTHASQEIDLERILLRFKEIYLSETTAEGTTTETTTTEVATEATTEAATTEATATSLRLSVREKAGRRRDESGTMTRRADVGRSERPDNTPCPSVEGLWMSANLETVFEASASAQAGRLDLRAIGSDWTGTMESLLGEGGPVSAFIGKPMGSAATFVGHCRVVDRVDSITGTHTHPHTRWLI